MAPARASAQREAQRGGGASLPDGERASRAGHCAARRRGLAIAVGVLVAVVPSAGLLARSSGSGAGPPAVAVLQLHPTRTTVPARFVGLSVEYWTLARFLGLPAAPANPLLAPAIAHLGAGGAPVLRLGGDSADQSWPAGWPGRPLTARFLIEPALLARLAAVLRATGATVDLTTNLAAHRPDAAAALLREAAAALPPRSLAAVAMGNEPDRYAARHVLGATGRRVRLSPRRYGLSDLQSAQRSQLAALRATGVPFRVMGPGFATARWRFSARRYLAGSPQLAIYASHLYPLSACNGGRARLYPADLLRRSASAGAVRRIAGPELAAARRAGLPLVVQEGNSVACGGDPGVSNHPSSALWATSILFDALDRGVAAFAFHASGSSYDPIAFRVHAGRWQVRLAPEYAGMLLFEHAAPPGTRVLAVSRASLHLRAWATRDRRGALRLLAVNDSARWPARLVVRAARDRPARILRLTTRAGLRLGGRRTTGWRGDPRIDVRALERPLAATRSALRLTLPPASAAVVTVGRPTEARAA